MPQGLLLALLTVRLVDESGGFLVPGAFESFRTDLGLSYTQASVVLVAAAPGAMVGNVFSVAADYHSRRVIATGGAFAFALALGAFGLADSFAVLCAAGFGLGLAATAMVDASEIALVDIGGDEAPALIARSHLFGSVGDLLGPAALIIVAASGVGWRVAFLVFATLTTVYACWLSTLEFPPPHPHPEEHRLRDGLRGVLRDRRVWFYAAVALLLGPLDEPFLAFLIAHLEHDRGLSTSMATAVASASIAGHLTGFALASRAGYRPSPRALVRNAATILVGSIIAVLSPWVPLVLLAMFAFGVAVARFFVALMARIVAVRPGQLGTVQAAVSTIEFSGFGLVVALGMASDAGGIAAGIGGYGAIAFALFTLVAVQARADQARSERAI